MGSIICASRHEFYLCSYTLKAVANRISWRPKVAHIPANDLTFEAHDKTNAGLDNFTLCFQRWILSESILAFDAKPAAHGITHGCTMEITIKPKSKGHAGQLSIL
jgi:hypothetical protein